MHHELFDFVLQTLDVWVLDYNDQTCLLPILMRQAFWNLAAFHFSFSFFFRLYLKDVYLKLSLVSKQNNSACIYPPKTMSIGCCQSLSRFYVKLPIHAVSIDQMTKCLFIFFSIQLVFLWFSDSSFISVSECPVLNG